MSSAEVTETASVGTLAGSWYTEEWQGAGAAISLKTARRLHVEQSSFQCIEVFETETFGRLLTLDGLVMVTGRDNFIYHEMLSHPALFSHPAPRDVLIIGGGDCGTLNEVLKHTEVARVVQVELDEGVTRVCERFFPELCASNGDPRAELLFADGIRFVAEAPAASFDVLLVDGTDPIGQAAGLFSEEFYRDCHRLLRPGGVLAGQTESPLFHADLIVDVHHALRGADFAQARTLHFPQCTYPSGWWSATLAARDGALGEPRPLPAGFSTRYYDTVVHQGALALPRFLRERLPR
ncbi:Polyamine aminopropyltransferase [Gammaproteobacteria bacterium]